MPIKKKKAFISRKAAKTITIGSDQHSSRIDYFDAIGNENANGQNPDAIPACSLLDFNLENEQMDEALKSIELIEKAKKDGQKGDAASFEKLIMKQAAVAGLFGSRQFDNILKANRGRIAPRGGSEDSRPTRRQTQEAEDRKIGEIKHNSPHDHQ